MAGWRGDQVGLRKGVRAQLSQILSLFPCFSPCQSSHPLQARRSPLRAFIHVPPKRSVFFREEHDASPPSAPRPAVNCMFQRFLFVYLRTTNEAAWSTQRPDGEERLLLSFRNPRPRLRRVVEPRRPLRSVCLPDPRAAPRTGTPAVPLRSWLGGRPPLPPCVPRCVKRL